ncbi:MAG: antitoxin Xre-like helix-turn-helix domain-containing protein [Opitutales bacterium]
MNKNRPSRKEVLEEPAAIYGIRPATRPGARRRKLDARETVATIRAGLPMVEFEALQDLLGLGAEELAGHLAISRSTLMRRRKGGRLDPQESDRLLRYARLFARAEAVLQNGDAARAWLKAPARALAMETPLAFAETEAGTREVENLLGRIEHGVFS